MDTAIELVTEITSVREAVPEGESHETEELNVLEKVFGVSPKKRIVYRKDFLLECFNHPASARCPNYPDFSSLDCTLAEARLKDINKAMHPPANSISLRPQSGNFSSGCAPNLSPAFGPNRHHRFQNQSDDQPKGMFDPGFSRRGPGVGPPRFEHDRRMDARDLGPRDNRDLGPRDSRDLGLRETRDLGPRDNRDLGPRDNRDLGLRDNRDLRGSNMSYGRRPTLFRPEASDSDWTRRRSFHRNDDHMGGRMRMGRDRDDDEPEWFTGGPTSQNETIELRGFQDDERRAKEAARESKHEDQGFKRNGAIQQHEVPKDERNLDGGNLAFNLEKILQMETDNFLSDLLPAAPGKSSRFAALFSPAPEPQLQHPQAMGGEDRSHESSNMLQELFAPRQESRSAGAGENQPADIRKTMEFELRRVLLGGGERSQAAEQPKEPPKQEDISAIQKLFSDLMAKSGKPENKMDPSGMEKMLQRGSGNPPPQHGLQNMLSSFGMMNQQQQQPHRPQVPQHQHQHRPTHNVPVPTTSPVMGSSNPLIRLMEQQHMQDKNAQKRSSTPIAFSGFTPTAVMRKMTGDQHSKASPHVTSFGGMPPINSLPTNSMNSGFNSPGNAPANNPLASFMSAISAQQQQQPPHPHHQMPPHQPHHQHQQMHPMQQNGPHMHSIAPPHGNMHVPPHHPGFHGPPRMPFPVMVGPPNGGMRAHGQFPPYTMYPPQMPQRK